MRDVPRRQRVPVVGHASAPLSKSSFSDPHQPQPPATPCPALIGSATSFQCPCLASPSTPWSAPTPATPDHASPRFAPVQSSRLQRSISPRQVRSCSFFSPCLKSTFRNRLPFNVPTFGQHLLLCRLLTAPAPQVSMSWPADVLNNERMSLIDCQTAVNLSSDTTFKHTYQSRASSASPSRHRANHFAPQTLAQMDPHPDATAFSIHALQA